MHKEIKIVVKQAQARGWRLKNGSKHYILVHPTGRKVSFSMTPSCPHAFKHVRTDIERIESQHRS